MRQAHRFEMVGDVAVFRPRASLSIDQAIWLVKAAIESARDQQIRQLMIITAQLDGFDSPSVASRHLLAREWARAAAGVVQIAVVARPDMIDPLKFGVVVAANFGARANTFAQEADALAWLQATR